MSSGTEEARKMTRETKVGLVVAGSFLCLVGVVIFCKLRERNGDRPETGDPPVVEEEDHGPGDGPHAGEDSFSSPRNKAAAPAPSDNHAPPAAARAPQNPPAPVQQSPGPPSAFPVNQSADLPIVRTGGQQGENNELPAPTSSPEATSAP